MINKSLGEKVRLVVFCVSPRHFDVFICKTYTSWYFNLRAHDVQILKKQYFDFLSLVKSQGCKQLCQKMRLQDVHT